MAATKKMFTCPGQKTALCTTISSHGILDWKDWTSKPQGLGPMICFHINGKLQVPAAATNMKPEEGFTTELQTKLSAVFQCGIQGQSQGLDFPPGQLWSEG